MASRYLRKPAFSSAARSAHTSGARQLPRRSLNSRMDSRASPTTGMERCLMASNRVVLIPTITVSSFLKIVQDPVVKSCNRQPMATTTSASAARLFAASQPVTPMGPTYMRSFAQQARLSRHGLHHRNVVVVGELGQRGLSRRIVDATAADDQRLAAACASRMRPQFR